MQRIVHLVRSVWRTKQDAAAVRAGQIAQARANLPLLNGDEMRLLVSLLRQNRTRLIVHITGPGYGLLVNGILVEVERHGDAEWVCDLHPGIMAIKGELLP
jgi:hypothetical protein